MSCSHCGSQSIPFSDTDRSAYCMNCNRGTYRPFVDAPLTEDMLHPVIERKYRKKKISSGEGQTGKLKRLGLYCAHLRQDSKCKICGKVIPKDKYHIAKKMLRLYRNNPDRYCLECFKKMEG